MQLVDVNVPRFNQTVVAVLTATAFVLDQTWLVAAVFLVLAVSWAGGPSMAPLTLIYTKLIRPRLQGPVVTEHAAPPKFAQLIGAGFLGTAALALWLGFAGLGWGLTLVVTALSGLAAVSRICVGCVFYEKVVAR